MIVSSPRERLVSVVAGRANRYIFNKKPTDLIPFRGNFPLLERWQAESYFKAIKSTQWIEDLPDYIRKAVEKGNKIDLYIESFTRFLENNGISVDRYTTFSDSKKSSILSNWIAKDNISDGAFDLTH